MLKKLLKRRNAPAAALDQLPVPAANAVPKSMPGTDVVPVGSTDYTAQKDMLAAADLEARLQLARADDTRPEILYYLAGDESALVRQAVAANPATPMQADELLVDDADDEVRGDLALKIARLLPDMSHDEQEKVQELTFEMLRRLASDQLPRVRALLAEELKSSRHRAAIGPGCGGDRVDAGTGIFAAVERCRSVGSDCRRLRRGGPVRDRPPVDRVRGCFRCRRGKL